MTDKEEAGTTSRLVAPSLQLLGHKGACLSLDFNHHGDKLAVACSDGHVYLWTFLDEDPQNYDDLPIHNNDVLQVSLVSCLLLLLIHWLLTEMC